MDKIKQFREKYPFLDFLAGFIPGVGEAQDAHDFSIAAKKNDYIGMGLASIGFVTPFTGRQLSAFIRPKTRKEFVEWARKLRDELPILRPRLDNAVKEGNERAIQIKNNIDKVAKGDFHIMEKPGLVGDVNPEHFIMSNGDVRGYMPTPETMMEAGMANIMRTKDGKLFMPNYIVGLKGTTGSDILVPGRAAIKKTKDRFGHETITKLGQFTSDDILTALYYSGHGKVRSSNAIFEAIDKSNADELAKNYAKKELNNIEKILQKYAKKRDHKPQVFKATGVAGWGRDLKEVSESRVDKGLIPENLINPKNEDQVLDRISLEESLNNLSRWFGAEYSNGVTEFFSKVPKNTYIGNYRGKEWGNITGFNMIGFGGTKKVVNNQDDVARLVASSDDPTIGIIQDIMDGAGKGTDIIMKPNQYSFKIYKKGGRVRLTTRNREDR